MKKYYTYELIDPRNNKVFYVGKGCYKRMYYHYDTIKNDKKLNNSKLGNKLKKLIRENLKPIYKKVLETEIEQEAFDKEIELIKFYGLENLCNLKPGGEGGWTKEAHRKGGIAANKIRTQKLIEKFKDVNFRNNFINVHKLFLKNNPNFRKKENNGFYGKYHTIETIEKIKKSNKGKQIGKLNSQFGTCWITNGKENKKIRRCEIDNWLNNNWLLGRKISL